MPGVLLAARLPKTLRARAWALAGASGAALALSFAPGGWPLAFAALAPLFWAVLEAPDAKAAGNLGALTGLVFYGLSLTWLTKVFGPLAAAFWCVFALFVALHAALLWKLAERGAGPWAWALSAGVLWTGLEYFRSEVWSLNCSWLALGYSQTRDLALLESCSVWGLYGLSGLLVCFNAAAALAARRRGRPLAGAAAAAVALLGWGARRLSTWPAQAGRPLRAAVVQDESYDVDRLAKLSAGAAARGAQLLVWPEYALTVAAGRGASYRRLLARKLGGFDGVAVIGAAVFPEDMKRGKEQNFAWVLGAGGALLGRYDKLHPIPYVEKLLPPNPDPRPVETPLGRLGVQICYDLDFENGVRAMARQGAQLLVVPDLDPLEWGAWQHRQHSEMSAARAVESGLWLVRAASSGTSQIIDPVGRVREALGSGVSGVLTGDVRLARSRTLYEKAGWLCGPLCLAATAGFLLLLGWEKARR